MQVSPGGDVEDVERTGEEQRVKSLDAGFRLLSEEKCPELEACLLGFSRQTL